MFSQPRLANNGEKAYHALSAFLRSGGATAPPPAELAPELAKLEYFSLAEELDKVPRSAQTKHTFEKIRKLCMDLKLVANEDDFDAAWVVDSGRFEWYASSGMGTGAQKTSVLLYGFEQHAHDHGVISNVYQKFPSLKNPPIADEERNEYLYRIVSVMNNPDAIRHIVKNKCRNPATAWDWFLQERAERKISTTSFCCALLEQKINLVEHEVLLHRLFYATHCTSAEDTRMIRTLLKPFVQANALESESHHYLRGKLIFSNARNDHLLWCCTEAIFDLYKGHSLPTLPRATEEADEKVHAAYQHFVEPRLDFFAMCGALARGQIEFVQRPQARNSWKQFKSMFRCYLQRDNSDDSQDPVMSAMTKAPWLERLSEAVLSAHQGNPTPFHSSDKAVLFMDAFGCSWARDKSCGLYAFMRDTVIPMSVAYHVYKKPHTHVSFSEVLEQLKDATALVLRTYME